jgi:AcrR family transcriptional regulator
VVARAGGSETEAVRDHILDAALRVITSQGLAAASTRAVAAEAGIGAGTVYNYFDNRLQLLAHAITRRVRTLAEQFDELVALAGTATVTANLHRSAGMAAAVLDEMVPLFAAAFSESDLLQAMHADLVAGEAATPEATAGTAAEAALPIDPSVYLERYLLAERELGRVAADADCRAAANIVVSLCHDRAFHRFFSGHDLPTSSLDREIDLVVRAITR